MQGEVKSIVNNFPRTLWMKTSWLGKSPKMVPFSSWLGWPGLFDVEIEIYSKFVVKFEDSDIVVRTILNVKMIFNVAQLCVFIYIFGNPFHVTLNWYFIIMKTFRNITKHHNLFFVDYRITSNVEIKPTQPITSWKTTIFVWV